MEIKSGIKYYIKAIAKQIIIFPRGKYFLKGETIEGNLDGKTLKLLLNTMDILEIEEIVDAKPQEVEEPPKKTNVARNKPKQVKEDDV